METGNLARPSRLGPGMVIGVRIAGALLATSTALLAGCSADEEAPACGLPANGEMRGTGTLWALFFPIQGRSAPMVAGEEVKIVWKIGGTGDFTIKAVGPDGAEATPVWGPTGHGDSTWERPGSEYGTGFRLPAPGCWTFAAQRDSGEKGEVRVTVA
ncbi:hypothetical protein AB0J74_08715 [Asanoa sp. NPDC049573]|uniref:hypothetical protein n=1 Tax=Asanoa sp. NPDC049573 TaxID=3155396 RepID=UPI00343AA16D